MQAEELLEQGVAAARMGERHAVRGPRQRVPARTQAAALAFAAVLLLIACSLLAAYVWHARDAKFPLLRLALFKIRTFRVSVAGGFVTRIGVGGLPFLLPLSHFIPGLEREAAAKLFEPTAMLCSACSSRTRC